MRHVQRVLNYVGILLVVVIGALIAAGFRPNAGQLNGAVDIAAPPAQVTLWLVEPERMTRWNSELAKSTPSDSGATVAGSRWRQVLRGGRQETEVETMVKEFTPGRQLVLETEATNFKQQVRYDMAVRPDGTRLIYSSVTRFTSPLLRLFEWFITRSAQERLDRDLLRLKALVESAG